MTFQSDISNIGDSVMEGFEAAKSKAAELAGNISDAVLEWGEFNPALNQNFPKQDELIATFDQEITTIVFAFKQQMLEARTTMPQPEPPIKPICAIWPGVPGGSKGF